MTNEITIDDVKEWQKKAAEERWQWHVFKDYITEVAALAIRQAEEIERLKTENQRLNLALRAMLQADIDGGRAEIVEDIDNDTAHRE